MKNIKYIGLGLVITGIAAINDLPVLRRLTLVGCGDIGLTTIEQKMSTLEWANTGATA